jgi:hypothetical protein
MLQVVDYPVLIKKPDGSHGPEIKLDNLTLAPESGPKGWNTAVLNLLNKLL